MMCCKNLFLDAFLKIFLELLGGSDFCLYFCSEFCVMQTI